MRFKVYVQQPGEPAGEYAYRVLRKNILLTNLKPGECISAAEVAEALHISRTPVQGAFARLMADGLLNIFPQRGSYVSRIDIKRIGESVFMRNLAEQSVIRVLCQKGISSEGLMELESNLHQQSFSFERALYEEVFELDCRFHDVMYDLCGMGHINQALSSISADQHRVRLLKLNARIRWDQTVKEHAELIEAIRSRDAERGLRLSFEHVCRIVWDLKSVYCEYPDYFENGDDNLPDTFDYRLSHYYTMCEEGEENTFS